MPVGSILNAWSHAKCDMIPFPLLTSALVPVRNGVKLCSLGEFFMSCQGPVCVCVFSQLGKKNIFKEKMGKRWCLRFATFFLCCFVFLFHTRLQLQSCHNSKKVPCCCLLATPIWWSIVFNCIRIKWPHISLYRCTCWFLVRPNQPP